jgi:citronellyl-CoA dehydrogenase
MAAMARWHLERTVEHCRGRVTFGRPLIDNQVIQFRLATHFTEVEELEQLTYRCVRLLASEYRANPLIPIAKLAGARVLREVADTCMQLHAGDGYQEPHLAQRFFRDARALSMAGGTDEMMLEAIGRTL